MERSPEPRNPVGVIAGALFFVLCLVGIGMAICLIVGLSWEPFFAAALFGIAYRLALL